MSSILITEASSTEYTYDEKLLESVFSTIVGEVELEKHLYAGSDLPEIPSHDGISDISC
jgi:hypothetical protein